MSTNAFTDEMSQELLHHVLGLDSRFSRRNESIDCVRVKKQPRSASADLSQEQVLDRAEELLAALHGTPDLGNKADPLDELIFIVLSGQTHYKNYERTWERLKNAFPVWDLALLADEADIEYAIAEGGLGRQKSGYLRQLLAQLRLEVDRLVGADAPLSLDFLQGWSDKRAERFLRLLPGIGPKTARCVMLYALGRDTCPVDTHVYRILSRMGVLPPEVSIKASHDIVNGDAPSHRRGSLHVNLVVHGRTVCTPRNPVCAACPLVSFCETGKASVRALNDGPAVVDLFAGAGGLSEGFRRAGYRIAAALEGDRHAAQTFRLNFPGTPVWECDIRTVSRDQIVALTGIPVGELAVLCAGPPCQGYSDSGKRDIDDPQNLLFLEFARLAEALTPKVLLVENVEGLRRRSNATFEHRVLDALASLRAEQRSSYHVVHGLLDVATYGVPQRRRRMIYLAARHDLARFPELPLPTHGDEAGAARLPEGGEPNWLLPVETVGSAFADLPMLRSGEGADPLIAEGRVVYNHRAMDHSQRVQDKINKLRPGVGPISYRRLAIDRPAHTVVAGHNALPVHPTIDRSITVREAARLQSFPDTFRFLGPRHSQALQVANAVPPQFSFALALCARRVVPTISVKQGGRKSASSRSRTLVRADAPRIKELVAQQIPDEGIAALLGVTESAIRVFRADMGIGRRQPGAAAAP